MRFYRQIRHLRRSINPREKRVHNNNGSHLIINRDKTKQNYIYFDSIYKDPTNTFVTQSNVTVKKSEDRDLYISDMQENKSINFSTTENEDTYVIETPFYEIHKNNSDSNENNSDNVAGNIPKSANHELLSNIASDTDKIVNSGIFAYNISTSEKPELPVGEAIPFNNLSIKFGHNIFEVEKGSFKIKSPGIYKIDFIIYTTKFSSLGSVQIVVDDSPVGTSTYLTAPGTPLISHEVLNLKEENHIIKVIVSDLNLSLVKGKNASIIIEKLSY